MTKPSDKHREQIAMAYNRNLQLPAYRHLSLRKLAIRIGLPGSTLHREIRRGLVRQPSVRRGNTIHKRWNRRKRCARRFRLYSCFRIA